MPDRGHWSRHIPSSQCWWCRDQRMALGAASCPAEAQGLPVPSQCLDQALLSDQDCQQCHFPTELLLQNIAEWCEGNVIWAWLSIFWISTRNPEQFQKFSVVTTSVFGSHSLHCVSLLSSIFKKKSKPLSFILGLTLLLFFFSPVGSKMIKSVYLL